MSSVSNSYDVRRYVAHLQGQAWARDQTRFLTSNWSDQGARVAAAVADYLARFPTCARVAVRWDDTGEQSGVLILSDAAEGPQLLIDFSELLAASYDMMPAKIRDCLGEEVYSGNAHALTNLAADVVLHFAAARDLNECRIGMSYLHGEKVRLVQGDGHRQDSLFDAEGNLALMPSVEKRFANALAERDLQAVARLAPGACRAGDFVAVLYGLSSLALATAKGELAADHQGLMHLAAAIDSCSPVLSTGFADELEDMIGNLLVAVRADPVAFEYVANTMVAPEKVRSPRLAGNLACVASLLGNKPALLLWAKVALERGKTEEDLLADPDLDAYRDDAELLAVMDGTGRSAQALGDALHAAAEEVDVEMIRALIAEGADVNHKRSGDSVLYALIHSFKGRRNKPQRAEALRLVMEAGCNLLPLHEVTRHGADVVNLFLEFGAKPSLASVCAAVESGDDALLEQFLQTGVALSPLGDDDDSPLGACRLHKSTVIAERLLRAGARLNEGSARYLLHSAASADNLVLLGWLLVQGVDPNTLDRGGATALASAAFNDNVAAASLLLERGCDVNRASAAGETVLHNCVTTPSPKIFELLLGHGADPNLADVDGCTPLHRAVEYGRLPAVRGLLAHGARLDLKNKYGKIALELAENAEIAALLKDRA